MMVKIVSLETIQREAQAAAQKHSDINAACPYPFGSEVANAFVSAFNTARQAIASTPSQEAQP
jgi:hypothetical protein